MRQYEVMYVLRPDLEEEKVKSNVARYSEVVTNYGGEISKLQEMGKRRLAYEVNGFNDGYYVIVNFQAEPQASKEVERVLKISDDVIKHMVIKLDD